MVSLTWKISSKASKVSKVSKGLRRNLPGSCDCAQTD